MTSRTLYVDGHDLSTVRAAVNPLLERLDVAWDYDTPDETPDIGVSVAIQGPIDLDQLAADVRAALPDARVLTEADVDRASAIAEGIEHLVDRSHID